MTKINCEAGNMISKTKQLKNMAMKMAETKEQKETLELAFSQFNSNVESTTGFVKIVEFMISTLQEGEFKDSMKAKWCNAKTHEDYFQVATTIDQTEMSARVDMPELFRKMKNCYEKKALEMIFAQNPDIIKIFENLNVNNIQVRSGKIGKGKKERKVGRCGVYSNDEYVRALLMLDGRYFLIYGKCQSGKTQFIQSIVLSHILISKCSAIVVLRNSIGDAKQLQARCDLFRQDFENWMKTNAPNFSGATLSYVYADKDSKISKLKKALSGENPSMVLAIANSTQMDRLKKVIDGIDNPKYVVAIDEADQVAYGDQDVSFREILNKSILEKAGRVYGVTATTFDMIFTEEKIKTSNIIVMKPKEYYKGLRNIELQELKNEAIPANKTYDWFENDRNVIPVLRHLGERTCHASNFNPKKHNYDQPVICLFKNTHLNESQLKLLIKIAEHPELKMWCGLVYNGLGITIYTPHVNLLKTLSGKTGEKVEEFENALFFKKAEICDGLEYFRNLDKILKEKGGERISHIAVIAGDLADRCISFVSRSYKWHLTAMYYVPSHGASIANILQSAGRLCGNFKDSLPLFLFAPKETLEDLVKGIRLQEEILERALTLEVEQKLKEAIEVMPISRCKLPSRNFGIQPSAIKKVVNGSDGGKSRKGYFKALAKIEEAEYEMPDEKKYKHIIREIPEEEFQRLSRPNGVFSKWAVEDTRIARFMQNLDPTRVYTKEEILQDISRIQDITQYKQEKSNRKGNGMIMKETKDGYILYPELVEQFNKFFNYKA